MHNYTKQKHNAQNLFIFDFLHFTYKLYIINFELYDEPCDAAEIWFVSTAV